MQLRKLAWIAWFVASLFYAYQYIIRVLPNVLLQPIMEKYSIDASSFASFSGIYYAGYVALHIPFGILMDRFGPRIITPIAALITAAGSLPLIYSDSWEFALASRFIIGAGSSAAILSVFKVIRMGFAEEKFSKMLGFAATIGLGCAMLGGRPVGFLMSSIGWVETIQILSLTGAIIALLTFFLIPNQEPQKSQSGIISDIIKVCSNIKVLSIMLIGGLMMSPTEGFADAWGTEFLKIFHSMDQETAEFLPSLIFIGFAAGSLVLGIIVEYFHKPYTLLASCSVLMAASFLLITLNDDLPNIAVAFALFMSGFGSAYQIFIIYLTTTYVSENLTSLASSIANMAIMAFGTFFHYTIAEVLKYNNSTGNYSANDYQNAILVIPFFIIVAIVLQLMHNKFLKNN